MPRKLSPGKGGAPLATARAGCGRGERGGCAEGGGSGREGPRRTPRAAPRPDPLPPARIPSRGAPEVPRNRDGGPTPSRRRREVLCSSRVVQQSRARCRLWAPHRGPKVDSAFRGPLVQARKGPLRAGKRDVPGIFVADPTEVWKLPDTIVTEVRPPPVPVTPPSRKAHVPGASWGSQPARTPMRRPGPRSTHLGRPQGPGPRPSLSRPPRSHPSPRPALPGPHPHPTSPNNDYAKLGCGCATPLRT